MNQSDPEAVIRAAVEAANRGDVEAMVRLFDDNAMIRLEPPLLPLGGPFQGRHQIREYVRHIVGSGFHVEPAGFRVAGDGVTWRSRLTSPALRQAGIEQAESTSQAVVQRGQIQTLTVHYSPEAVERMRAAAAQA